MFGAGASAVGLGICQFGMKPGRKSGVEAIEIGTHEAGAFVWVQSQNLGFEWCEALAVCFHKQEHFRLVLDRALPMIEGAHGRDDISAGQEPLFKELSGEGCSVVRGRQSCVDQVQGHVLAPMSVGSQMGEPGLRGWKGRQPRGNRGFPGRRRSRYGC